MEARAEVEKVRLGRAAFLAKGLLWHPLFQTGTPTQVPLQKGGPGSLEGLTSHGKFSLLQCLKLKGGGKNGTQEAKPGS